MPFTPSIRHSKCCHTHPASFANTSISIRSQQHCHHHTLPTTSVAFQTQHQAFEVLPYTSSIAVCKQHQNYHMNCQTLPATELPASTFNTKHRYSVTFSYPAPAFPVSLFRTQLQQFPVSPYTPSTSNNTIRHPAPLFTSSTRITGVTICNQ